MGKIMKASKVVLVLNGRYAGRKAMILRVSVEESSCLKALFFRKLKSHLLTFHSFLSRIMMKAPLTVVMAMLL